MQRPEDLSDPRYCGGYVESDSNLASTSPISPTALPPQIATCIVLLTGVMVV